MRGSLFVIAGFTLLTIGCAPSPEPPAQPIDLEAARAAVMAADDAFVEASSASDDPLSVMSAVFLDYARVLAPGAPMAEGKEAIMAMWAEMRELPGFSLRWKASIADVGGGGDLGYTIGEYHMEFEDPEGNPVVEDGKYMTIWKKQADGTWSIAVDMFNSNGEAPGAD